MVECGEAKEGNAVVLALTRGIQEAKGLAC
jgi:hypothetical protein